MLDSGTKWRGENYTLSPYRKLSSNGMENMTVSPSSDFYV